MHRLILPLVCVAVAALANPPTARAIAVTITYSIGGGTFNGPFSSGPVTGGTLVVRYPNAVSLFSAPAPASVSLLTLTLTGPSGFFQVPTRFFYPLPQPMISFVDPLHDLAVVQCLAPYCTPQPVISGTALITSTWVDGNLVWTAHGPSWMPRIGGAGRVAQGPFNGGYGGGAGFPHHRFSFSPSSGSEVARTCDTPPCPARTPVPTPSPTPLPPLVGDLPMCKDKRGMQVTVLVPASKMQRLLDRGLTLGECPDPTNGRVLCKRKRGKRVNVLLPDSKVQRALNKGFCTLGECWTP